MNKCISRRTAHLVMDSGAHIMRRKGIKIRAQIVPKLSQEKNY
jgi:hypothetical protein